MGDLTNYYILCIEDPSYLRSLIAITLLLDSWDAIAQPSSLKDLFSFSITFSDFFFYFHIVFCRNLCDHIERLLSLKSKVRQ